ncbi:MAG: hypothetical protein GF355_04325 [Candidatus Eisenbacteria bacterium]|nr:hypothetical protein [Candidatus Eisenbacteria bacterium]
MSRVKATSLKPLGHALLTWRMMEDWYQEELQGSPWVCINPECPHGAVDLDDELREGEDGHFHCTECGGSLYYRCGKILLPVGDVVPPDVCESCCSLKAYCVRYRLHQIWQRDMGRWQSWMYRDLESPWDSDELWEEEVWNVREPHAASRDGNSI